MLSLPPGEFREHQSIPQCCSSFQQLLLGGTNLSIPHPGMEELLEVIPAGGRAAVTVTNEKAGSHSVGTGMVSGHDAAPQWSIQTL